MTVIPIYRPYVFLRCGKCGKKTDHVLINTSTIRKEAIEETYECQQCGETKKIYELASMVETPSLYSEEKTTPDVEEELEVLGLEERVKAKRKAMEQLESRKRNLEKRLEVRASVGTAGNKQPLKPEEQKEEQHDKKKRKWF